MNRVITGNKVSKETFFNIRYDVLICFFIVIATLAVYNQVRYHDFVNYDDPYYITENFHVQKGLTVDNIIWAFTSTHALNWHPLTWLSHMLDVQLYGMNPASHHLTNVLFHILNTLLLFFILRRMTGKLWRSSFVAVLFALHPLHVESVAWVAERKDVLSTFFWMLTLWGYARYVEQPGVYRYLLVLTFFILGLLAKPMVITLPFVLLLLDFWPLHRFEPIPKSSVDGHVEQKPSAVLLILEKAPLFLLAAVSSIVTLQAQQSGGAVGSLVSYPLSIRIANALVAYTAYIGKMIWPEKLAVYYPHPGVQPWWQVTVAGVLIVFVFFLAIWWSRKHSWFLVGWLWYMGTLVPVIGLIQVGSQAMADRYTYIPLIGLFIIISWGIPNISAHRRFKSAAMTIAAVIIVCILMITTWIQVGYWKNSVTLFEHTLDVTTNNYLAHNNLGVAFSKPGSTDQAIVHYTEALRLLPDYKEAHFNLGVALYVQGKIKAAVNQFSEALRIDPGFKQAHKRLATALVAQGHIDAGIRHYLKALAIDPDYKEAHKNLAVALLAEGRVQEVIYHYSEALRIDPSDPEVHNNLGNVLFKQGQTTQAIRHYSEALRFNPAYAEAHNNLGAAMVRMGKLDEAKSFFREAIRIKPDFIQAHNNLDKVMAAQKN
jgi:tetratricopeptide (TPR) repeat protein